MTLHVRMFACVCVCVLPVYSLAVVNHLPQLFLTNILHHNHGADPEDIREAKVDNAVSWIVVSPWRYRHRKF